MNKLTDKEIAKMLDSFEKKFRKSNDINKLFEELYNKYYGEYREIVLDAYLAAQSKEKTWANYRQLRNAQRREVEHKENNYK